jgi:Leucyl aminopeptidase
MKLKLDFVTKVPKVAKDNQVILLKDKTNQNKIVKSLYKSIFANKLFLERKFLVQNINDKTYVFVNCMKSKTSLDYEKLGSNLFLFLKNNKIEKSFFETNLSNITNTQLEKFLHGAQLKSYEFNVYKTDKSKNPTTYLYVVGHKSKKMNVFRNKLNSLLAGVFLTRDLVSEPGNVLHPDEYARRIVKLRKFGLKVTVYDQKKLKKMGMNALLGVGQGSVRGSYLVTIEWKGTKSKSNP